MQKPYSENEDVRDSVNYLLALPFIPLEDVVEVFDSLLDDLHETVIPLYDYVDETYVRGKKARGRRAATAPRFEPAMWNVYESVLNKLHRTNNSAEAWHAKFLKMIITTHSPIWKFLEFIQNDEHDNRQLKRQLLLGHTNIKYPKKDVKNEEAIETAVTEYEKYKHEKNILMYLKRISYRIKRFPTESTDNLDGITENLDENE